MNYQKQTQAHNIEKITTHSLSFHTHQSHTHGTWWRTRIADKDERFFSGNAQIDIMTTKRQNDWPSRRGGGDVLEGVCNYRTCPDNFKQKPEICNDFMWL